MLGQHDMEINRAAARLARLCRRTPFPHLPAFPAGEHRQTLLGRNETILELNKAGIEQRFEGFPSMPNGGPSALSSK